MTNVVELVVNQFDLLGQLSGSGRRSELDSLDEGVCVLKLVIEPVRCLYLENVVAEGNDVRDCLHLELLRDLEESANLPLLILSRILLFVFGARGYNVDAAFGPEDIGRFGHELRGAQFDPALGCISDDQHKAVFNREPEKLRRVLIDLL